MTSLFGLQLSKLTPSELVNVIISDAPGFVRIINYINAHGVNLMLSNLEYSSVLRSSDIIFCDGFGVKIIAKLKGIEIGQRMTPPDWIDELFMNASYSKKTFYFVGDEDFVIKEFIESVLLKHPNVSIVGSHHGFFLKSPEMESALIKDINQKEPDVILVGMGMPLQEMWASKLKGNLKQGSIISVGALFRWYSGIDKRAPRWLTSNGFEWLARLMYQPKKVWKRYIFGIPLFLFNAIYYEYKSD